jgi:hypothetical protein
MCLCWSFHFGNTISILREQVVLTFLRMRTFSCFPVCVFLNLVAILVCKFLTCMQVSYTSFFCASYKSFGKVFACNVFYCSSEKRR